MSLQKDVVLHTNFKGFASTVDVGKINTFKQLEVLIQEILRLPLSHSFEEGYEIEYYTSPSQWSVLTEQNFGELKEVKLKVRVTEKLVSGISRIPAEENGDQAEYIGVNIQNASLGKLKYEDSSIVLFFKKNKTEQWKSFYSTGTQPIWNENFAMLLPPDSVNTKDARINETLVVKIINSLHEEEVQKTPVKNKREEEVKETKKKEEVVKFEINLSTLKKGEPSTTQHSFKTGNISVEYRWFGDDRTVFETNRNPLSYKESCSFGSIFFLPPPKDSFHRTSKRRESMWFSDLRQLKINDLKKGDIIVGKYFGSHPIQKAQKHTVCTRASKYTVHVAIVGEDGGMKIVESSEHRNKVSISPQFPEADYLVYRAYDQSYAKDAADWAVDVATNFNVAYSIVGLTASIRCNDFDEAAKVRQRVLATKKNIPRAMMSAQFVVAAYQCRVTNAYIKLNSLYVSPMELEEWLNHTHQGFYFCGKIPQSSVRLFNIENYNGSQSDSAMNIFSPRIREMIKHTENEQLVASTSPIQTSTPTKLTSSDSQKLSKNSSTPKLTSSDSQKSKNSLHNATTSLSSVTEATTTSISVPKSKSKLQLGKMKEEEKVLSSPRKLDSKHRKKTSEDANEKKDD